MVIGLTALKKRTAKKIWRFNKFNSLVFLNKNPDRDDGDKPLANIQQWEECKIFDVLWIEKKG